MNPQIALIICLIFVTALLILDHKLFKLSSIAGWIPTVWLLYCASRPLGVWFAGNNSADEFTIAEGSPMDRIFLLILMFSGLVVLIRRNVNWGQVIKENRWLLFLFFYMLISSLWSEYHFVSFKRWIKAFCSIMMALVVVTSPLPLKEFNSIIRRTIYVLIPFSVLLIKYFPQIGMKWGRYTGAPIWAGAALGKNTLGALTVVAAFFLIWTFAKRSKQKGRNYFKTETNANLVVLGLTFLLLRGPGGAYSATSIVILIVGLFTLFLLRRKKTVKNLGTIVCLSMIGVGLIYFFLWALFSTTPLSVIIELTGRDPTLSGRTDQIWGQLIPIALEKPIFGLGYGGFWLQPLEFDKLTVNQAHNGYLDIFLELGVVGLIIFAILLIAFYLKITKEFMDDIEWGSFRIAFLLMSLLQNYTESVYIKSTALHWNILIMLMMISPENSDREVSRPTNLLKSTG